MKRHCELLKLAGVVEKIIKANQDKVPVQIKRSVTEKQNLLEEVACKFINVPPGDSRIVCNHILGLPLEAEADLTDIVECRVLYDAAMKVVEKGWYPEGMLGNIYFKDHVFQPMRRLWELLVKPLCSQHNLHKRSESTMGMNSGMILLGFKRRRMGALHKVVCRTFKDLQTYLHDLFVFLLRHQDNKCRLTPAVCGANDNLFYGVSVNPTQAKVDEFVHKRAGESHSQKNAVKTACQVEAGLGGYIGNHPDNVPDYEMTFSSVIDHLGQQVCLSEDGNVMMGREEKSVFRNCLLCQFMLFEELKR